MSVGERVLKPVPLTSERFAPFGDVVETSHVDAAAMNDARFERFDDLCNVDVGDGRVALSIATSRVATRLPYVVSMVERHPLGSQAFIPLAPCRLVVVVAPAAGTVDESALVAFVSNGHQGINYKRGTWHMPLLAFETGQRYLIVDRAADRPNCDVHELENPVLLEGI